MRPKTATPRDRTGSFEPELVRKRETILAENLEPRSLECMAWDELSGYSAHIEEMYDMKISHRNVSQLSIWFADRLELTLN